MAIRAAGNIWRFWPLAVVVRVVAVVALVVGPWTDQPHELSGWDVERFQEIVDRNGSAWVDEPVEYPPGSVLILDTIAGSTVVETNRRLVLLSAGAELAAAIALWRAVGPPAAKAFLLLGLPLVPMGLLRLDLVVIAVATVAALLLTTDRTTGRDQRIPAGASTRAAPLWFGVLVTIGAMIKIWPGLLLAAALARRHVLAAAAGGAMSCVAGLGWLAVVGNGVEPVDQVLSLRGATGWHVESLPGSVVSLFGTEEARLELNAFRIGNLSQPMVWVGRVLAITTIAALVVAGYRRSASHGETDGAKRIDVELVALVMLGSTAALMVTAPLLSPQFLLWLTPWGAMLFADRDRPPTATISLVVATLSAALVLTGVVLTVFGPPDLAGVVPAFLLVVRNGCLIALPIQCFRGLTERSAPLDQASVTVG